MSRRSWNQRSSKVIDDTKSMFLTSSVVDTVSHDLKIAIQQARNAKKLKQTELATVAAFPLRLLTTSDHSENQREGLSYL